MAKKVKLQNITDEIRNNYFKCNSLEELYVSMDGYEPSFIKYVFDVCMSTRDTQYIKRYFNTKNILQYNQNNIQLVE